MPKEIVIDTETTGIEDDDQVIQIASLVKNKGKFEKYSTYVQHKKEISIGAMSIHHIRKVNQGTSVPLFCTKAFMDVINANNNDIVIGHNIEFDLSKMRIDEEQIGFNVIDTMLVADYLKSKGLIKNKKTNLQYLRYFLLTEQRLDFLDDLKIDAHDALFDVLVTWEIYKRLIDIADRNLIGKDELVNLFTDRKKPENLTIRFGKHKGKTVSVIMEEDKDYLAWFYFNVEGNEDIKNAIVEENSRIQNEETIRIREYI